jgi:NTP pyrophosphatase (non-canonical NTP hydrolase)
MKKWSVDVPDQPVTVLQSTIQQWADRYWAGEYWPPLANLARLLEESGEIARGVNQQYGPKRVKSADDHAALEVEMGDLLFVLLCLANSMDVNLQQGFEQALEKYRVRDEDDE